jgi:hypothetical protein
MEIQEFLEKVTSIVTTEIKQEQDLDYLKSANSIKIKEDIKAGIYDIEIEKFNNLHKDLYMGICQDIDDFVFGKCGGYWLCAYKYPKIGDTIKIPVVCSDKENICSRSVKDRFIFTFTDDCTQDFIDDYEDRMANHDR